MRADYDRKRRRRLDRLVDLREQRNAAAQFARINPHVLLEIGEGPPKFADERIVARTVRNEERAHGHHSSLIQRIRDCRRGRETVSEATSPPVSTTCLEWTGLSIARVQSRTSGGRLLRVALRAVRP